MHPGLVDDGRLLPADGVLVVPGMGERERESEGGRS